MLWETLEINSRASNDQSDQVKKKTEVGSERWNLGFYLILAEERD